MKEFIKKYFLLCLLLFTILIVIMPHDGNTWDIDCWKRWAEYIQINGLGNIYYSDTDYLPLFHYVLKIYGSIQGSIEEIGSNIHHLKLITLFFHFLTGYFLLVWIRKAGQSWDELIFLGLFYLLNIAVLYNTVVWGQVDDILVCLVLISSYFAYKKNVLASLVFIVLAINFKLQAIIFLPVIGLMLLPEVISSFSLSNILKWLLIPFTLQIVIILPFIFSSTLDNLWSVVTGSVGKWPSVSMNAYNIWDLLLTGDLYTMLDSKTFMSITYKQWGLLMFFIASGVALFPLMQRVYISVRSRVKIFSFPLEKYLIICGMIPLLFFYLNTQMHERYTHPAFVFLIAYSLYTKKPFVAILGCLAYFLNLEGALQFMHLPNYGTLIFNREFVSLLYLVTIIGLYADLYGLKFIRSGVMRTQAASKDQMKVNRS